MSEVLKKVFVQLHMFLYRLSGGALGGKRGKSRVLLLTTTGRKTGKQRTTPLRYIARGDAYMIAASNWGQPEPPAWFKNMQANPTVQIQVMDKTMTARMEIASAEQHDTLYQQFIEADFRFADYPKTARRIIPVIILHPQS
jgi:F420H(2)-dependent quinone reductase